MNSVMYETELAEKCYRDKLKKDEKEFKLIIKKHNG